MATDKTIVLITGANTGIGFCTAEAVAASPKCHVIIGSRSVEKGKEAVADIQSKSPNASISVVQLDVTDQKSIENAVSSITQEVGRLDVLINNAGIASFAKPFVAELREIFETNVFGAANITENFLPLLSESNDARLIYVSSGLGNISRRADPADLFYKVDATSYRMAKAALNMLTACHHYEHAPRIKVWAFCPGYVVTDLSGTGEQGREERRERGAGDPKVSGENLAKIVHGERDADVGKFVHGDGVYPW